MVKPALSIVNPAQQNTQTRTHWSKLALFIVCLKLPFIVDLLCMSKISDKYATDLLNYNYFIRGPVFFRTQCISLIRRNLYRVIYLR